MEWCKYENKTNKIGNYKSIGEEQSLYLGENNVISIIGQNESGKSNILSILSELSFHKNLDLKTFEKFFRPSIFLKRNKF